jgi:hypothetical protein
LLETNLVQNMIPPICLPTIFHLELFHNQLIIQLFP